MARIQQGVFSWEDVLASRYQRNKPTPLPRRRNSLGQEQRPSSYRNRETQRNCRLLTKLSPELRLMIWELVLGGLRLHIIQRTDQRLGHIICPVPDCEICEGGGIPQPAKDSDLRHEQKDLLGLSKTCKQIYAESIPILYTHNIFEFSNTWSLTYLRLTVPPDLWDEIRRVELRWAFPGHWLPTKDPVKSVYFAAGQQQWIETCKAVTRMKNLQSFALILPGNWFCEPAEKIPAFLEPLRELRLEQPWVVVLPCQPYYVHEIDNIGGELRQRGIDAAIRVMC